MKYLLSLIALVLVVGSCDNHQTGKRYDPGCHTVPPGEPSVFCSGDSIQWDCVMQERYVNGKLRFHYSKDSCCDAIIETLSGTPTGTKTPVTEDQVRKGMGLELDDGQRE